MDYVLVNKIAAWASIFGILIPALIYTGKQLISLRQKSLELHSEFENFIELIVNSSTTVTARADAGNYLNIENRRWHSLTIRTYIQSVGVIVVMFPFILISLLVLEHWLKYLIIATSVFSIVGQIVVCVAIGKKAESHSRKILDSWSKYVEKNIDRATKICTRTHTATLVFVSVATLHYHTKTLSAVCAGELGVKFGLRKKHPLTS